MNDTVPDVESLHHHRRKMGGRDTHEQHRVATPLELLFDLTFVVSFGLAANEFAHAMAAGHFIPGLMGFGFASFAICWAWINFSWFSSAYDTDDWIFRIVTMVQMTGVLILAIGLPDVFKSIEHGEHLDNSVMVFGYVVMRVALIFQWLRAAKQDPSRREICLTYAIGIALVQIGWVILIFTNFPINITIGISAVLIISEMLVPYIAEHKGDKTQEITGTPWHAHHIAERYMLFAIIALGEGVVGTVATLSAAVHESGWTLDTILVCFAGIGLTFGLWWVYLMLPSAVAMHNCREKSFGWGYGQMIILAAIVATGAGLHVAAYFIEHKAHIGALPTLLTVAIPVGIFILGIYTLYWYLLGSFDKLHLWLLSGALGVIIIAIIAAVNGVNMANCLVILTLAPVISIIGYEISGHRHQAKTLANHPKHDAH